MTSWISQDVSDYLIVGMIAIILSLVTLAIALARVQAKKIKECLEVTKAMVEDNRDILLQNMQIAKNIKKNTDGINSSIINMPDTLAFTKEYINCHREDPHRHVDN